MNDIARVAGILAVFAAAACAGPAKPRPVVEDAASDSAPSGDGGNNTGGDGGRDGSNNIGGDGGRDGSNDTSGDDGGEDATSTLANDASSDAGFRIGTGDSGPPIALVNAITNPLGLTAVAGWLYWVEGARSDGGAIWSMPATGGSPTAVYSSGLLTGGLTADGTRVYFTVDDADAGMDLHSVLPDGGMEQTLASFLDVIGSTASKPCALSVAAGNVYMAATTTTGGTPAIYSVPIDGGPPRLDVASPTVSELLWADSSGIYFSYQDEDAGTGYVFGYAPLGGGPLSAMGTEPPGTGMGGAGWTGDFVVAAGSAYFIQASPPAASQPTPAALMKLVPPSGPLVRVATYPDEQAILDTIALVGDSRGLYEIQAQGVGWGIYEIDPSTGVRTLLAGDPSAGAPYDAENIGDPAAIDATNVYFTEISASGFSIWALPR